MENWGSKCTTGERGFKKNDSIVYTAIIIIVSSLPLYLCNKSEEKATTNT